MKKVVAALALSIAASSAANASVIISFTGSWGYVEWSTPVGTDFGLTQPVSGFFFGGNNEAVITVGSASTIDFSIADVGVPGDAFALTLDGYLLSPTSGNLGVNTRGPNASGYFSASYEDIFLIPGEHAFALYVTDSCCSVGWTTAYFSAVSPVTAQVPEPASLALVGLGLIGLSAARRRKTAG